MHLCGTRVKDMCTSSAQHQRLSLSLFPLSPSPNNKPTFLHKFFTPFSLVLFVLFPFASKEQQYPSEDLNLKEQYPGKDQNPSEDRNPSANQSSPSLFCPLAPPNLQSSLYLLGKIKFFFSLSILWVRSSDLRCGYRVLVFKTWVCVCSSDLWCGYGGFRSEMWVAIMGSELWCGFEFDLGIRSVFVIFDLGICGF